MDPYAHYQQQTSHSYYDPSQSYQSYYATYNQEQQYPYDNHAQYYSDPNYHQHQQYQYQNEPTSIHPPGVPIPPDTAHLVPPGQTHQQYYHYTQPQVTTPYVENLDSSQQGSYGAVPLQTQDVPK